jgi:hypothetical protein
MVFSAMYWVGFLKYSMAGPDTVESPCGEYEYMLGSGYLALVVIEGLKPVAGDIRELGAGIG